MKLQLRATEHHQLHVTRHHNMSLQWEIRALANCIFLKGSIFDRFLPFF